MSFRAAQHQLLTTEKPTDSMLLSAVMQSAGFPPHDPWASGYTLSYYYFGQVMGSSAGLMAATNNTTTYNAFVALYFALTAQTTFGVVYNMVTRRAVRQNTALRYGLLGVLMVMLVGNYQMTFVEIPYQTANASPEYLQFWDVPERGTPIEARENVSPETWGLVWYFRATRVINDRVLPYLYSAQSSDAVTEFPAFSFIHSEAHAHVIVLFVTITTIGAAFGHVYNTGRASVGQFVVYAILCGCAFFTNAWSYPVSIGMLIGAEIIRRIREQAGWSRAALRDTVIFAAALGVASLLSVGLFITSYQTPVRGFNPNLWQATRLQQLFLVMGALLPLTILFVARQFSLAHRAGKTALAWATGISTILALGLSGYTLTLLFREATRNDGAYAIVNRFFQVYTNPNEPGLIDTVMPTVIQYRLEGVPTLIVLFTLVALILALLLPYMKRGSNREDSDAASSTFDPSMAFALFMMLLAVLLQIVPEFFYVADGWGTRNETLFKFYNNVWALLGIAVTYGMFTLLSDRERRIVARPTRAAAALACVLFIVPTLPYAPTALWTTALLETRRWFPREGVSPMTLDGGYTLVTEDDEVTLRCLQARVGQENVVVASGVWNETDRYSRFNVGRGAASGRVGAFTGYATLLGWGSHEAMWRGDAVFQQLRVRAADTRTLYQAATLEEVQPLIDQYGIDYILYGTVERHVNWYGEAGEQKFLDHYDVVCEHGTSRIFRVE
jgi:YYY domain-containing protein